MAELHEAYEEFSGSDSQITIIKVWDRPLHTVITPQFLDYFYSYRVFNASLR